MFMSMKILKDNTLCYLLIPRRVDCNSYPSVREKAFIIKSSEFVETSSDSQRTINLGLICESTI